MKPRLSSKRKDQVVDGVYDGRYKTRVVVDKKKQAKKLWARIKNTRS